MSKVSIVQGFKILQETGIMSTLEQFCKFYPGMRDIVDTDPVLRGRFRLDKTTNLPRVEPDEEDWRLMLEAAKRIDSGILPSNASSRSSGSFNGVTQTVGAGGVAAMGHGATAIVGSFSGNTFTGAGVVAMGHGATVINGATQNVGVGGIAAMGHGATAVRGHFTDNSVGKGASFIGPGAGATGKVTIVTNGAPIVTAHNVGGSLMTQTVMHGTGVHIGPGATGEVTVVTNGGPVLTAVETQNFNGVTQNVGDGGIAVMGTDATAVFVNMSSTNVGDISTSASTNTDML